MGAEVSTSGNCLKKSNLCFNGGFLELKEHFPRMRQEPAFYRMLPGLMVKRSSSQNRNSCPKDGQVPLLQDFTGQGVCESTRWGFHRQHLTAIGPRRLSASRSLCGYCSSEHAVRNPQPQEIPPRLLFSHISVQSHQGLEEMFSEVLAPSDSDQHPAAKYQDPHPCFILSGAELYSSHLKTKKNSSSRKQSIHFLLSMRLLAPVQHLLKPSQGLSQVGLSSDRYRHSAACGGSHPQMGAEPRPQAWSSLLRGLQNQRVLGAAQGPQERPGGHGEGCPSWEHLGGHSRTFAE